MTPDVKRIAAYADAISEAERFIIKARRALADLQQDKCMCGTPATAAAKRSSMDLTRALATLRRNPYA